MVLLDQHAFLAQLADEAQSAPLPLVHTSYEALATALLLCGWHPGDAWKVSDKNVINLENFHDRPVQAEIVSLLVLTKGDAEFATCVLIHGMGGTGKVSGLTIILSFVQIGSDFAA